MRGSWTSRLRLLSILLTIGAAPGFAAPVIGSGPGVGSDFALVSFREAAGDEALYVAWRDAGSNVASGVLHLEDGSFDAFPSLASGYLTNLSVGAGGPAGSRRAYATWVDSQLHLRLAVFDPEGQVVSPTQSVANSVQIAPNKLIGTNAGVLIGHAWDEDPYWDPRILEVDALGNVLDLEIAADVSSPEQTLGTTVAGDPDGSHVIAYITSDTHLVRLRRYDSTGPLDPSPVVVSGDATADFEPLSAIFRRDTPSRVLLAFPYDVAGPDVRFAVAPLSAAPVSVGPVLSDLVPGFAGRASDMVALADPQPRAVIVWQDVEREDPATCGCSVPQPVRIDFFALVLAVGSTITAEGQPLLVYRWLDGDPIGPPVTEPTVAVASEIPGRFTVLWSDGVLRYIQVDAGVVAVEDPVTNSLGAALSAHPNPFTGTTTLSYSLLRNAAARITIVDVRGRVVARLADSGRRLAGGLVPWNGGDNDGRPLPPGIYFARLEAPGVVQSTKLVRF